MQKTALVSTLLAVNPGRRYLGIAVLQGAELLDWRVKGVKTGSAADRLAFITDILNRLIDDYQPRVLVLKDLHPRRTSMFLKRLTVSIRQCGARHGLFVSSFTGKTVRRLLLQNPSATKRALAQHIAAEYPMLQPELDAELSARDAYHIRMFEAVGLAMAARRHLGRI